jgi:hypothetical protein
MHYRLDDDMQASSVSAETDNPDAPAIDKGPSVAEDGEGDSDDAESDSDSDSSTSGEDEADFEPEEDNGEMWLDDTDMLGFSAL